MHKIYLLILLLLISVAGCATRTYDEKMERTDRLFTQGRYVEAENSLAHEAEDNANKIIPKGQSK